MALPPAGSAQATPGRPRGRRALVALVCSTCLATSLALLPAARGVGAPQLTIAQAEAALNALQSQEDAAVERFDAGTIALSAATTAARAAGVRADQQKAVLAGAQRTLAAFAAAAYTSGGGAALPALLAGSGGISAALQRAADLDEIARMRTSQETVINAQQVILTGLQQRAAAEQATAAATQRQLEQSAARIKTLIADQQGVLNRLQAQARAALLAAQAAARAAAARAAAEARAEAAAALAAQRTADARAAAAAALAAQRAEASRSRAPDKAPSRSDPLPPVNPPSSTGIAAIVLAAAYSQRGKPYQWGAAGPNSYDCSGLVLWAFAKAGISLPHSAALQYGYGTHVSLSDLEPGDLVFYDDGATIGHVVIYVGGGEMIDANHTGGWVDVRPMRSDPVGATRL